MKKYVKPELVFESFKLSQNIAACYWDTRGEWTGTVGNTPVHNEQMDLIGVVLFNQGVQGCTTDDRSKYCYTNGSGDMNIFNS